MPIDTIAPPVPKPVAAVEPVVDNAAAEAAEQTPAATKPRDPIAARIAVIAKGEADPGREAEPEVAAQKTEDADTDDAIKADVDKKTQRWEPGQKKAFTDLRYAERDARRSVKDLTTKLEAAEAKGKNTTDLEIKLKAAEEKLVAAETVASTASKVDPKEVDDVRTKLTAAETRAQELEKELHVAAVERTDEFANAITKPKKRIEEAVAAIAKKHELNARTLQAALYGTDEEQAAAVEGLTGPEQTKFYSMALEAQNINERAEVLRTNAALALTKINERKQAESEQKTKSTRAQFEQAHTENWKTLTEALPILQPVDGTDEVTINWNKSLADAKTLSAAVDFDALPAVDRARVAIRDRVFPNLVGALQLREATIAEQTKTIETLTAEVTKFRSNKPGNEVTPKDEAGAVVKAVVPGAKGTAQRIQEAIGGLGR